MKIFLDMDGVLCDFVKKSCEIFGKDIATADHWDYNLSWGINESQFWDKIDEVGEDFWAELEEYPHTQELLKLVSELDRDFYICTSPSRSPSCYTGKLKWLSKRINKVSQRTIFIKNKWELSAPGRILIDDKEKTFYKWNILGGRAILWPEYTNSLGYDVDLIEEKLEEISKLKQNKTILGV